MKKAAIIIFILVMLGFGIWLLFNKPPSQASTLHTEPTQFLSTTSPIVITSLSGDVTLKETKTSRFQTITKTATTTVGSEVKTSSTGRALIESAAAHTTLLDYNTDVILTKSSSIEKKTSIELLSGSVWARLKKVFDKGESYQIKTNNAIAVVSGTSFGLSYSGSTTTLIVTDGSVTFSARDTDTGEILPGSETIVSGGQKAVWNGSGLIVVTTIEDKDRLSPWFIFNNSEASATPQ